MHCVFRVPLLDTHPFALPSRQKTTGCMPKRCRSFRCPSSAYALRNPRKGPRRRIAGGFSFPFRGLAEGFSGAPDMTPQGSGGIPRARFTVDRQAGDAATRRRRAGDAFLPTGRLADFHEHGRIHSPTAARGRRSKGRIRKVAATKIRRSPSMLSRLASPKRKEAP